MFFQTLQAATVSFILILIILSANVISITEQAKMKPILKSAELSSPSDWIKQEQIRVSKNGVVLNVRNPFWAEFANTNSMDPFIDEQANAIEISPKDPAAINIGDVISYKSEQEMIIHRVIQKSMDEQGIYFIVKGDNNPIADPVKVRFSDIQGVVVAVIY